MKLKKHIVALIVALVSVSAIGQGFYNRNNWKRNRHEFSFGAGVSNFLGDLGGRDQVGTDFIWDLEISQSRFSSHVTYMYYLARSLGWRWSLSYGKVSGDDALTLEPFRENRNLNFQSHILEFSSTFEIQLKKETIGNRYNLRSPAGKKLGLHSMNLGIYGVVGIGLFYFDPVGVDKRTGQKHKLKPLKTEGQGLPGGPEEYKNYELCIPLGFGIRRSINRNWGFKIELTHRFTFTDYIDDVSTVYYDKTYLDANLSPESAYFSNPMLGSFGPYSDYMTRPGQQRGDPTDDDGYMFMTLSFNYRFDKKRKSRYGRHNVRRIKASF